MTASGRYDSVERLPSLRHATIARLIAARAAAHPDCVAIQAPGRTPLTYAGLLGAVGDVAQAVRDIGLGRADRMALVLENGPELAAAFLTVAAAIGCAPLNPRLREEDFAFAYDDFGIRAVAVEAGSGSPAVAAARRRGLPIVELETGRDAPAGLFSMRAGSRGATRRPDDSDADPTQIALVLHTSGTTARPKTVPLTHANLCASAANIAATLALEPSDVCLNVMPLFHIHGLVGALLSSIAAGAAIECGGPFRAAEFVARLPESGATWYSAVPTIHQAVLDGLGANGRPLRHRLRFVRSSSAALPTPVLSALSDRFGVPVIEAYGMTEASHQMASNPLAAGGQKPGSVGLPAGPELALLDGEGRIVSAGTGEVVVRGPTVMTGYERNPEATATAFVDGWFRTGDQGRIDADGYLFLTGRLKELINRGGEKIAPREVEEALLRDAAVAQAVAFAVPHPRLGEEVGAAVVLKPGASETPASLREHAAGALSFFKVPRTIALVDRIPTGPTGKVQRSGLAAVLGIVAASSGSAAPRTPLERALAAECARLLKLGTVGIDDDFFALGGDSLAAAELLVIAAEQLGVEIPPTDFLERPTIAGMIESAARVAAAPAREPALARISRVFRSLGRAFSRSKSRVTNPSR